MWWEPCQPLWSRAELDTCFVLWIRRLFPSGPCHAVHDLSLSWAVPLLNWRPASSFRAQSLIMLFPRVILQLLWKPDVVFAVSNTNSSKTRQRPWGLTGEEQSPWGLIHVLVWTNWTLGPLTVCCFSFPQGWGLNPGTSSFSQEHSTQLHPLSKYQPF